MADKPANTPVQDQYAERFASELEGNRTEQSELRARLEQLQADEEVLLRMQSVLTAPTARPDSAASGAAEAAAPEPQDLTQASAPPEEAPVPQPRQEASSGSAAPAKKPRAKKAAAKTVAKKTAAGKTTAKKTAEPSLGELLLRILAKDPNEPLTAAEVVTALEQEFPERARDTNTVRNTLERLVARSLADRAKQGKTVYYTGRPPTSEPAAQTPEPGRSPAAETVGTGADEKSKKVPVEA
ncbi:hypothetical protein ABZ864_47740 [Streptomyces sp. NPDC047082]|uniref:hypothetical protein n=1 Tax=Streptomyces sp. NPDC047082 TaxID=3155259 RepID=UPI0033E60CCF